MVIKFQSKRIHFKDVLKQLKRHVNEESEWVIVLYRQNEQFSTKIISNASYMAMTKHVASSSKSKD
jgi:hypothetical protein